jgi:hypothetical protein
MKWGKSIPNGQAWRAVQNLAQMRMGIVDASTKPSGINDGEKSFINLKESEGLNNSEVATMLQDIEYFLPGSGCKQRQDAKHFEEGARPSMRQNKGNRVRALAALMKKNGWSCRSGCSGNERALPPIGDFQSNLRSPIIANLLEEGEVESVTQLERQISSGQRVLRRRSRRSSGAECEKGKLNYLIAIAMIPCSKRETECTHRSESAGHKTMLGNTRRIVIRSVDMSDVSRIPFIEWGAYEPEPVAVCGYRSLMGGQTGGGLRPGIWHSPWPNDTNCGATG